MTYYVMFTTLLCKPGIGLRESCWNCTLWIFQGLLLLSCPMRTWRAKNRFLKSCSPGYLPLSLSCHTFGIVYKDRIKIEALLQLETVRKFHNVYASNLPKIHSFFMSMDRHLPSLQAVQNLRVKGSILQSFSKAHTISFVFSAFRLKNALHDSQVSAPKLKPLARSPQTYKSKVQTLN